MHLKPAPETCSKTCTSNLLLKHAQCCPGGPLGGQRPLVALFSALNTEKRPPGCRTAASGGRPLRICVIAGSIECWPAGWWPGGWRGWRGGAGWWSGGPGSPPPHPQTTLHHPRHKSISPIVLNIACLCNVTITSLREARCLCVKEFS